MNSHTSALAKILMVYLIMGAANFGGRAGTQVLGVTKRTNEPF